MRCHSLPHTVLSLFTSAERAAAIEGDLLEEREARGRAWFAMQTLVIALALFQRSFAQTPARISLLCTATIVLSMIVCWIAGLMFLGPDAPFPSPGSGLAAISAAAFLLGAGLMLVAPTLGAQTVVSACVVLSAMLLATRAPARLDQLSAMPDSFLDLQSLVVILWLIGDFAVGTVVYLTPLLLGTVAVHILKRT